MKKYSFTSKLDLKVMLFFVSASVKQNRCVPLISRKMFLISDDNITMHSGQLQEVFVSAQEATAICTSHLTFGLNTATVDLWYYAGRINLGMALVLRIVSAP